MKKWTPFELFLYAYMFSNSTWQPSVSIVKVQNISSTSEMTIIDDSKFFLDWLLSSI